MKGVCSLFEKIKKVISHYTQQSEISYLELLSMSWEQQHTIFHIVQKSHSMYNTLVKYEM